MDSVGGCMKLSTRLTKIAEQIPTGSRLADIGSDHALLPVFAMRKGMITEAIAGEVNVGPRDAAQRQVNEAGLKEKINVRLGNGLAVIQPGEVDVVTIAGMGGVLIVSILSEGLDKLEGVKRLILQPNVGEENVRRWLLEHNWYLSHEQILEEDGRIYEILTADRLPDAVELNQQLYKGITLTSHSETNQAHGYVVDRDSLLRFGPYLIQEGSSIFQYKWSQEIHKLEKVAASTGKSENEEAQAKSAVFRQQLQTVKEVLLCLQKDKL